jgi:nicotinate-nucleotide--dimethylbenzimidazole phosphoribosyltransferase
MTPAQAHAALQAGMDIVRSLPGNVVAFGEMGIANTSAAALLFARLAGVSIDDATGRGTGLDDAQLAHKRQVLAMRWPAMQAPRSP